MAGPPEGAAADHELASALLDAWQAVPVAGAVLAGALRGAAAATADLRNRESVELVWTGPTTAAIPLRQTESVLLQTIRGARERVVLVSFVAYEVPSVTRALRDASSRGVRVTIVLESSTSFGGRVDTASDEKMRSAVPNATIYFWNDIPDEKGFRGAVHAKCAVADEDVAFVTSANLTSAAMSRNMELGVLFRGGRQPRRLARHIEALIEEGILSARR